MVMVGMEFSVRVVPAVVFCAKLTAVWTRCGYVLPRVRGGCKGVQWKKQHPLLLLVGAQCPTWTAVVVVVRQTGPKK